MGTIFCILVYPITQIFFPYQIFFLIKISFKTEILSVIIPSTPKLMSLLISSTSLIVHAITLMFKILKNQYAFYLSNFILYLAIGNELIFGKIML